MRHQIGNKLEIEFLDQGEKTVKNLAQPVHVYFINLASPTVASPAAATRDTEGAALLQEMVKAAGVARAIRLWRSAG